MAFRCACSTVVALEPMFLSNELGYAKGSLVETLAPVTSLVWHTLFLHPSWEHWFLGTEALTILFASCQNTSGKITSGVVWRTVMHPSAMAPAGPTASPWGLRSWWDPGRIAQRGEVKLLDILCFLLFVQYGPLLTGTQIYCSILHNFKKYFDM